MPRGYPDFFGSATFFKFGNLRYEIINTDCPAGATTTILEVAYKGKTYGGKINLTLDTDFDEGTFLMTLDGEAITWATVAALRLYPNLYAAAQLMTLSSYQYDGTDIHVQVVITPDITFDYQFKLAYLSGSAAEQTLSGGVLMAEVA